MEIILLILAFLGLYRPKPAPVPTPTPIIVESVYSFPIDNFSSRITKKPYGIYITPQDSPISPETFTGFHTGTDIEYEDVDSDVPVYSIADGKIIYSGIVTGYGGFIAIQYPDFIAIYGHLHPHTLTPNGTQVTKNQQIAKLGKEFSIETFNERKHLHFGIVKGDKIDFRGYVDSKFELDNWLNPLNLYSNN